VSTIRVTYSAMGQQSRATVKDDADDSGDGYYRWRKMPGCRLLEAR
jgi:hypothetical protein